VAKAMAESKDQWQGTLVFVGQPAEELVSGAKAMVADGMYVKYKIPQPDYLTGLHTSPIPTGTVTATKGDIHAGTDQFDVTFHGIGGHGSSPHLTKDPVLMACAAVVQYQFIVSRAINPLNAAVITVGSIQAGNDNNVIPASAIVKINLRWYDSKDRELMIAGIERINNSIAAAYNLPESLYPTTNYKGGAFVLSNNDDMVERITPTLQDLLGEKYVITNSPKLMVSEDFPHLVIDSFEDVPYLFMNVGTALPDDYAQAQKEGKPLPSNHNPGYKVDLASITIGVKIGVTTLFTFLEG